MQQQQHELFQSYEIKNWSFSPRLYKIFGAAAVLNIFTLFVMAQANIFTTRGCDSPLVGNFCQVLDTIYLGSTLLNSSGDFESREYVKRELKDAEITFVDVTNAPPPLTYPAGYFALANPESFSLMQSPDMNGFPALPPPGINGFPNFPNPTINNGTDLMAIPQVTPTPNNKAVIGQTPDSPFSFGDNPIGANPVPTPPKNVTRNTPMRRYPSGKSKITKGSPSKLPDLGGTETAENKPDEKPSQVNPPIAPSEAVTDFKPNRQPLEDFAEGILEKRADKDKQLDLTKSFKVQMVGELDKDGKLNSEKSRYTKFKPEEQGDQAMIDVAKEAIEAINNSGLFYYLKNQGVDKVEFTLVQDDKQIYAVIKSSQKDEDKARSVSSGLNGLLTLAKFTVKEAELKTLIESAKVEQKGKNFVLNFKIDKPVAQEMINRKLQEAEAKKKAEAKQSNSTAETSNTNQKTAK